MFALPRATSWLLRRSHNSMFSTVISPLTVRCFGTGLFREARQFKSIQAPAFSLVSIGDLDKSNLQNRNVFEKIQQLLGGLVSFSAPKVPKGFENFIPKNKSSDSSKPQESAKQASSGPASEKTSDGPSKNAGARGKEGGGGGGGGGGGAGKGSPGGGGALPANWQMHLTFAVLVGVALMVSMQPSIGREINMQEFLSVVLESGKVDHLQVVNGRIVKVFLQVVRRANNV